MAKDVSVRLHDELDLMDDKRTKVEEENRHLTELLEQADRKQFRLEIEVDKLRDQVSSADLFVLMFVLMLCYVMFCLMAQVKVFQSHLTSYIEKSKQTPLSYVMFVTIDSAILEIREWQSLLCEQCNSL